MARVLLLKGITKVEYEATSSLMYSCMCVCLFKRVSIREYFAQVMKCEWYAVFSFLCPMGVLNTNEPSTEKLLYAKINGKGQM